MRTITLEEHFTTPKLAEALNAGKDAPQSGAMAEVEAALLDLGETRISDMDEYGIDLQVLSLTVGTNDFDASTAMEVVRDANNTAAQAVKNHPDRFAAFANLALQDPQSSADELRRCINDLGFVGGIINGTTSGKFLDHPDFAPVLAAAQELDVPMYLHPAPPPKTVFDAYYSGLPPSFSQMLSMAAWGWHSEVGLHILRMIVAGVFDKFPKLKIIIGHMGEDLPFSIVRADSVLCKSPEALSRKPSEVLTSNIWITTSGYFSVPPFACAMEIMGPERILFSVDYPYSKNGEGRAFLNRLSLEERVKELICYATAEKLLKL